MHVSFCEHTSISNYILQIESIELLNIENAYEHQRMLSFLLIISSFSGLLGESLVFYACCFLAISEILPFFPLLLKATTSNGIHNASDTHRTYRF